MGRLAQSGTGAAVWVPAGCRVALTVAGAGTGTVAEAGTGAEVKDGAETEIGTVAGAGAGAMTGAGAEARAGVGAVVSGKVWSGLAVAASWTISPLHGGDWTAGMTEWTGASTCASP